MCVSDSLEGFLNGRIRLLRESFAAKFQLLIQQLLDAQTQSFQPSLNRSSRFVLKVKKMEDNDDGIHKRHNQRDDTNVIGERSHTKGQTKPGTNYQKLKSTNST